jgi:phage terminase large subunit-like protein
MIKPRDLYRKKREQGNHCDRKDADKNYKKNNAHTQVYGFLVVEERRNLKENEKECLKDIAGKNKNANRLMNNRFYKYACFNRHKKQIEFHQNPSRNKWVFGGNRTGKTECGAVETVMWATGEHFSRDIKHATEGWVISLTSRMSRDITQAKILKYLDKENIAEVVMHEGRKGSPEHGVIDFMLVNNKHGTKSKITFKTCEQGREKFQGASVDYIWFDEEPPEDIYLECLMRTLDRKGSCIWATMTPLKGKTWVYDKIYLNPKGDIACMYMSWEDNPYLSKIEVAKMQNVLAADVLESRKFGRFMEGTGLVFSEFCETENVIDPFDIPDTWYTCVTIDPGFTNPCAVLWIVVDPDENIYVVQDYSVEKQSTEYHAREIFRISDGLGFARDAQGNLPAIIDSASLSRNMGSPESIAEQFINLGIKVDTKVNKQVMGGIMKMKALFKNIDGARKLFIFKNCTNLIKELKSYWWGKDEKPTKRDDHCIDALRYFVSTSYENKNSCAIMHAPNKPAKNALGKAKEKLAKQFRANQF